MTDQEYIEKLEEKLMCALNPVPNRELAENTKKLFKNVIFENLNEDTYTIKKKLKKAWEELC